MQGFVQHFLYGAQGFMQKMGAGVHTSSLDGGRVHAGFFDGGQHSC